MEGIIPYLQVSGTGDAISWYETVFSAREVRSRLVAPDGTCMNAEIEIGGTRLMLADEMPKIGSSSPRTLNATTVVLNLHVPDADTVLQKAIDCGAEEIYPLENQFYGDRAGRIRDPFGHHWIIATRMEEVSDTEMLSRFHALF
ncbi:VOC family protein [Roseibium sp. RKSG952]|uniref:VOC family protein n=1 Tax=Roseibium sp. RKSG952 TaxID=2529384 RepID=UPI0012BBE71A|nr:VOC family protein [Roseibium sp. RKSG952]MTH99698.1 VOC family protein [Roseibium sp. RKSG952]